MWTKNKDKESSSSKASQHTLRTTNPISNQQSPRRCGIYGIAVLLLFRLTGTLTCPGRSESSMKLSIFALALLPEAASFQFTTISSKRTGSTLCAHGSSGPPDAARRVVALCPLVLFPAVSVAGIDVSGLKVDGGGGSSTIKDQLRTYDGSASTRVQEIKSKDGATASVVSKQSLEEISEAATYAYRYAPGFGPRLQKLGFGERFRCEDKLVSPSGNGYLVVKFDFPSDWLQLDKMLGGIQYVDQRNGDKLYILKAKLPPNTTLTSVPKQFFGKSLFDPNGTISKGGIEVDEYKVSKSTIISDGSVSSAHRRLLVKYYSVTGNGLRTERRGLIDAYEVGGVAYMLFTGSNAAKFEANGRERETVESIVDSFQLEQVR